MLLFVFLSALFYENMGIDLPELSLRRDLLNEGRKDLIKNPIQNKNRRSLLCVSFMRTDEAEANNILSNAKIMPCEWVIIFFNVTDAKLYDKICDPTAFPPKSLIHCNVTAFSLPTIQKSIQLHRLSKPNDPMIPSFHGRVNKALMYFDTLPFLYQYKKVILIDSDISFENYNIHRALKIWDCTLRYPPLIAQPLISGRLVFPFLHENHWVNVTNVPMMRSTLFIEQQVPLLDTMFLRWFISHVMAKMSDSHLLFGSSWGPDTTWCRAALDYGKYVLNWHNYHVPCAVFTGLPGVRHLDTRSIPRSPENKLRNKYVYEQYKRTFPFWVGKRELMEPNRAGAWEVRAISKTCAKRRPIPFAANDTFLIP